MLDQLIEPTEVAMFARAVIPCGKVARPSMRDYWAAT